MGNWLFHCFRCDTNYQLDRDEFESWVARSMQLCSSCLGVSEVVSHQVQAIATQVAEVESTALHRTPEEQMNQRRDDIFRGIFG